MRELPEEPDPLFGRLEPESGYYEAEVGEELIDEQGVPIVDPRPENPKIRAKCHDLDLIPDTLPGDLSPYEMELLKKQNRLATGAEIRGRQESGMVYQEPCGSG